MERELGHLLLAGGDARTLCGLRSNTVPVSLGRHAQAHIDGYGARFCDRCYQLYFGEPQPVVGQLALFEGVV